MKICLLVTDEKIDHLRPVSDFNIENRDKSSFA
jgi:hypothetical protein